MSKKVALCSDTGIYKSFMDLIKINSEYMKNVDKAYQQMFSQEMSNILISGAKFFITSFNSFNNEEKLRNIELLKNELITYDLIVRSLFEIKLLSIKQFSNIGLNISKINAQLCGYEKKIIEC